MDGAERGDVAGATMGGRRPAGPRLLVPAVERLSDDALDRLLGCYALMEEDVARRRAERLAREGEAGAEAVRT